MTSLLTDAFEHHAWATRRLLDTCLALTPEQLATTVPGTFGSIVQTMRHLVSADASYLSFAARPSSLPCKSLMLEKGLYWVCRASVNLGLFIRWVFVLEG